MTDKKDNKDYDYHDDLLSDNDYQKYASGEWDPHPIPAQSKTVDTTGMSGKTASKQQEEAIEPVTKHPLARHALAEARRTEDFKNSSHDRPDQVDSEEER